MYQKLPNELINKILSKLPASSSRASILGDKMSLKEYARNVSCYQLIKNGKLSEVKRLYPMGFKCYVNDLLLAAHLDRLDIMKYLINTYPELKLSMEHLKKLTINAVLDYQGKEYNLNEIGYINIIKAHNLSKADFMKLFELALIRVIVTAKSLYKSKIHNITSDNIISMFRQILSYTNITPNEKYFFIRNAFITLKNINYKLNKRDYLLIMSMVISVLPAFMITRLYDSTRPLFNISDNEIMRIPGAFPI